MKQQTLLVVTSLLAILLLTLHITDDIVRGISKAEPSNTALLVLVVFLYGTLVLAEQRSGHVIMLLVGLFAAAMPVVHMRGAHYGDIAQSTGGPALGHRKARRTGGNDRRGAGFSKPDTPRRRVGGPLRVAAYSDSYRGSSAIADGLSTVTFTSRH